MGRCRQRTGSEPAPGPAFPGISPALPSILARQGRSAEGTGGVGGAVCGLIFAGCAPPGISPREPPLLRGSPLEGAIRFSSAGRGVPLPDPHPQVIAPRSGAWADAGEEQDRGRLAGPAFPGISPALPLPGGGEERTAGAGQGGGDRRAMYGPAFPGSHHESARSCAGALGEGRDKLKTGKR